MLKNIPSLENRDNPPTVTGRSSIIIKTDRTVDVAHDYIRTLEIQVRAMEDEHSFLQQKLEKALKRREHPSVGSWQNSDGDNQNEDMSPMTNNDKQTIGFSLFNKDFGKTLQPQSIANNALQLK